jgi:hypothetical protein
MMDIRITAALMLVIIVHPITATADIVRCTMPIHIDATIPAGDARAD